MDMQENVKVMMDKVAVLKKVVGKYMMRNFKDMPLTGDQSRLLFVIKEHDSDQDSRYLLRLVKAADKISALIKCIEEETTGNTEFRTAKKSIQQAIREMAETLPEVDCFTREFLPAYGKTLDELS